MNLNFKYYNSNSLIILIGVLFFLYFISYFAISSIIPDKCKEIKTLSVFLDIIGNISPSAFILLILGLINNVGWKFPCFKWLVDLPNLNGRYIGELVSSYPEANGNKVKTCVIEIVQTASSIVVYSYYADKGSNVLTSKSESKYAEVIKKRNKKYGIIFFYENKANSIGLPSLNDHDGTAILDYYPDDRVLKGEYFTKRLTKGNIEVKFVQEKLLDRL